MGEESPQYTLRCQLFGHEEDVSAVFLTRFYIEFIAASVHLMSAFVATDPEVRSVSLSRLAWFSFLLPLLNPQIPIIVAGILKCRLRVRVYYLNSGGLRYCKLEMAF
jgi:hypothetical protein